MISVLCMANESDMFARYSARKSYTSPTISIARYANHSGTGCSKIIIIIIIAVAEQCSVRLHKANNVLQKRQKKEKIETHRTGKEEEVNPKSNKYDKKVLNLFMHILHLSSIASTKMLYSKLKTENVSRLS